MEKRGISHIEFIISFIIFITFVAFAIFLFNPLKDSNITNSALPFTVNEIIKNTSVDLTIYSIKINKNAIPLNQKIIAIDLQNILTEEQVRVESYTGQVLRSKKEGNIIYFDFSNEEFVLVKSGKDFLPYSPIFTEKPAINENYYAVASSSREKIVSEKRLIELNDSYYKNYEELKNNLKIPGQTNFGFSVRFTEQNNIIAQNQIPQGIDIFSYSKRTEILRVNGESKFTEFEVKIW